MRSKIISVLVLTVFFLSLPFACGLFSSQEKQTQVFTRNDYTIKRDITVKADDKTMTEGDTNKYHRKNFR